MPWFFVGSFVLQELEFLLFLVLPFLYRRFYARQFRCVKREGGSCEKCSASESEETFLHVMKLFVVFALNPPESTNGDDACRRAAGRRGGHTPGS